MPPSLSQPPGLEYAKFFAKKGYRLFLLSRSEEKLAATKQSIQADFPQCKEVQTLAVDFANADIYDEIQSKLKNLRIDVLVNNVGISYPFADYFTKIRCVRFGSVSLRTVSRTLSAYHFRSPANSSSLSIC